MKSLLLSGLAVLTLAGVTPAVAQYAQGNAQYRGNWDSQSFWRDASADPRDRIQFLQRRIDRGIADGSLTRREARHSQRELDRIRRDARRMGRHLNDRERATLQARLDDVAREIRWQRHDNDRAGYGYNRGGPDDDRRFVTDYDASRYYREDPRYQERRLGAQDEVYRGSDGRYYCKRNDGTTGLIIGAAGGGVLGNVLDGGHNRVAGTLVGGALGALLGKTIDQNSQNSDIRCR